MKKIGLTLVLFFCIAVLQAQSNASFEEIIYGRKDGVALTMLQFKPSAKSNSKAIVWVVAGAWNSSYSQATTPGALADVKSLYTDNGFTVFEVIVGSQQRFAIPEQVQDVKRAVRYIRYNAARFSIDPDHIGITGYSAGGHLALCIATTDDKMDKTAQDPIDRVSSRVQAVAVLFPPTNFLNWDGNGFNVVNTLQLQRQFKVTGAFDFRRWTDSTRTYDPITDTASRNKIAKEISPVNAVSPDDPPVFIMHGDEDNVVPLYQSESIIALFKKAGVANNFIIKKGGHHAPEDMLPELKQFPEWFSRYLK
jgi:acetyl esterase/lipase